MNEQDERLEALTDLYAQTLCWLGEDPAREGLLKTPRRVAKSMLTLTAGYDLDAVQTLRSALFQADTQQMVLVREIPFYTLCEHHLLPFFGKAHVAYLPDQKITGLSKLARVVDIYARRLQVQERLTKQICDAIEEALQPQGVMVVLEAQHLCMQMRGVEKEGTVTTTQCSAGRFLTDTALRSEVLAAIGRH